MFFIIRLDRSDFLPELLFDFLVVLQLALLNDDHERVVHWGKLAAVSALLLDANVLKKTLDQVELILNEELELVGIRSLGHF